MMHAICSALLGLVLSLPSLGWAAVAIEDTSSSSASFADTLTFSHVSQGANRYLVCAVQWTADSVTPETVSSVTFNGSALTSIDKIGGTAGFPTVELLGLVAPASTTANVVVTLSAAVDFVLTAGCVTFSGVDQTTPNSGYQEQTGTVSPDGQPSLTVTSATDDYVLNALCTDGDSAVTVGAGQASAWINGGSSASAGSASTKAGATSVVMSYGDLANFTEYAHSALNIKASSGSGAETFGFLKRRMQ